MRTVAVVGGGASGMMAAITAAEEGAHVVLLEQKERTGKKILSTGNGRCNFTNMVQDPVCYRSENPLFPWGIIEQFTARDTIAFFLKLGIYSKNRNGYLYPQSDQASAVLDVLCAELKRLNVEIRTGVKCTEIIPGKTGFRMTLECREILNPDKKSSRKDGKPKKQKTKKAEEIKIYKDMISADRVILCAGSKAAPVTGSDGSGYDLAKSLGHHMIPVLPALVQLRCRGDFFASIAGVRVNAAVSVWAEGKCAAKDQGEVQLTDYGISGIPVFQVSRYASRLLYEKKEVEAELDFMPDFTLEQLTAFLMGRAKTRPEKTADLFLIGLFHKKLSDLLIRMAGIAPLKQAGSFTEMELAMLSVLIKQFRVPVTETNSYEQAQVCCGGADTREVDDRTLESRYVPGLYFAGELLDVDGMCGGYNLQWAWASGYVAGKNAAMADSPY